MTDDNVVKMPNILDRQAKRIQSTFSKEKVNRSEWVEIVLERADALTIARAEFKDNAGFGQWLTTNGFGENLLSHQDRAALLQFGLNLPLARSVLEKTERRSVQMIYQHEWPRLTSTSKTPSKPRLTHVSKTPPKSRKKPAAPKTEAVQDHVDALVKAGKPVNRKVIAAQYGVGEHNVQLAKGIAEGKLKAEAQIKPEDLSLTAQQKLDMAIRQHRKALDQEFAERVRLRVVEESKEHLAYLEQRQREARKERETYERLTNNHKPFFTMAEFDNIRACLHPDNSASTEKRAQAFNTFNLLKYQLTGQK